jgi:hypothetical protein
MASITSWIRLEPRARDRDLLAGVEARLHDPLWLLARQWQLGELDGADAGSAVTARTQVEVARLDAVRAPAGAWRPLDPDRAPLEVALGPARDALAARPPLHRRARGGRQLSRMLVAAGHVAAADDLLARFPLAVTDAERALLDDGDARFLAVVTGRVPDGDAALAWLRPILAAGDLPGDLAPASATCRAWLAWCDEVEHTTDAPAWQPDRLAYAFEARAGDLQLVAADHRGGPVRWHSVDAHGGEPVERPASILTMSAIPARVRYRGMPARRYWELEDAAVRWPAIDVGPGDPARLLFLEFGLTFGDDWLVVPIDVPAGSVARIASLVVTDTFGVRTRVRSAADLDGPDGAWHFTELSRAAEVPGPLLFIPPATGGEEVGEPLDAIDFTRDEMANVVWGIERIQRGADGRPCEVVTAGPAEIAQPAEDHPLVYRVGPTVPDGCHPYVARGAATGPELVRARVPGISRAERPDIPAELPIAAIDGRSRRLATAYSLFRSPDGSYHLALRRRVGDVAPTGAIDLAFDRLVEEPRER